MIQFLNEIAEHFSDCYPREGCGVLVVRKGKLNWVPCTNKAKDEEDFIFDSTEYIKIHKTGDIVGIVHSHPDAPSTPSELDIANCNALGIKYYIFSYPIMDLTVLEPETKTTELYGREYEFGTADCFEAMRDCYAKKFDIHLPNRVPFEDDWWLKGLDYFSEQYVSSWGFQRVELSEAKAGSLLVFAVGSEINNHCGVYLGNNVFYHHAHNRLSCREQLDSVWIRGLTGVYNYVA